MISWKGSAQLNIITALLSSLEAELISSFVLGVLIHANLTSLASEFKFLLQNKRRNQFCSNRAPLCRN